MLPIKIQVEDKKNYGVIAYLMDSDEFLADVQKIREKISLINLPYRFPIYNNEVVDKIVARYYEQDRKNLRITLNLNHFIGYIELICKKQDLELRDIDSNLAIVTDEAKKMLIKYKKSDSFYDAIVSAILTGVVHWEDFEGTITIHLDPRIISSYEVKREIYAIVVTPESTITEVEYQFKKIRRSFDEKWSTFNELDKTISTIGEEYGKIPDTKPNINRDRKWYWMNKKGLGYQKIANLSSNSNLSISKQVVANAVADYKTKLFKI